MEGGVSLGMQNLGKPSPRASSSRLNARIASLEPESCKVSGGSQLSSASTVDGPESVRKRVAMAQAANQCRRDMELASGHYNVVQSLLAEEQRVLDDVDPGLSPDVAPSSHLSPGSHGVEPSSPGVTQSVLSTRHQVKPGDKLDNERIKQLILFESLFFDLDGRWRARPIPAADCSRLLLTGGANGLRRVARPSLTTLDPPCRLCSQQTHADG